MDEHPEAGGAVSPRRLCVLSLGFARQPRLRRILALAGWPVRFGWPRSRPGPADAVGVWGQKPVAARGRWLARRSGAPLVTIEDGFLRSVRPGVTGEPPLSLLIDPVGVHYDPSAPSLIERMLLEDDLSADHARAAAGIARLRALGLSKYNACDGPAPAPGYVLVIDQTRGDASVAASGADAATFRRMLEAARAEHPGAIVVVRTHPDVATGRRAGHLGPSDLRPGEVQDVAANPWRLVEGARAVYTVSSQLGYEALLAGRPVRVFGLPFYAGWGLTEDESRSPRRGGTRTPEQLFAASHLRAPAYYDPWQDCLCPFERAVEVLETLTADARAAPGPVVATGMRLWKRPHVAHFLGPVPRFVEPPSRALAAAARTGRELVVWAGKETPELAGAARAAHVPLARMEDGFLRSVGIGARLIPAASLVLDRSGIYYDPSRESDLERLIAGPPPDTAALARAARLREMIVGAGVTKYNTGADLAIAPPGGRRVILVPGQVEDDASILRGAGEVRTNLALLEATRAAAPEAFLIYKPHPDVEAGLRDGAVPEDAAKALADLVAAGADPAALLALSDEVWTMTSLMGFEALLRGKRTVCFGMPFYAGWGLTEDRGVSCLRRIAKPSRDHLVWAALIAYPRYRDPVSGLACPPEVIVSRLAARVPQAGRNPSLPARLLARAQGAASGWRGLWQ